MKTKKLQKNICKNILKKSKKIQKDCYRYDNLEAIPCYKLDLNREPFELFEELFEKHKEIGAVKLECDWDLPNCFKCISRTVSVSLQCLQGLSSGKNFKLIPGLYTIKQFKDMADSFEKTCPKGNIEEQYWDFVNNKNKKVTNVQYGSDLSSSTYGSGFPKFKFQSKEYFKNKYNFYNINQQQDSLFQILKNKNQQISGVSTSWMYLGMRYASFCWHTENMFFPSLNYHHEGANRTWYFIPEADKSKFDEYFKQKFQKLGNTYSKLLNKIIVQIDPLQLKKRNIKVFKAVQTPKSFILTFPKVYHCGFSHGFNITEALNVCFSKCLRYLSQSLNQEEKCPLFPVELFSVGILSELLGSSIKISSTCREEIKQIAKDIINKEILLRQKFQCPIICQSFQYNKIQCSKCKIIPYLSYLECQKCHQVSCLKCMVQSQNNCNDSNMIFRFRDIELEKMLE